MLNGHCKGFSSVLLANSGTNSKVECENLESGFLAFDNYISSSEVYY